MLPAKCWPGRTDKERYEENRLYETDFLWSLDNLYPLFVADQKIFYKRTICFDML